MVRTRVAAIAAATLVLAGCSGGADPGEFDLGPDDAEDATTTDDGSEADEDDELRMPDVVGMHVDEAVELLEEAGFRVSTGIVRTRDREPELVHRSEPPPGRLVQEGQGIVLRVAAEPRE
jgi:hypothetical protein